MFRSVPGGAGWRHLFRLNWAEFGGNGVTVQKTTADGGVGGSVPATLSLSLGTPASFGAFTPGVTQTYEASTTANVISTAGDAALSVADPSSVATGHLVNGSFALPQALRAKASSAGGDGRSVRSGRRVGIADCVAHVREPGVQRRRGDDVPAGDRLLRRLADGQLQQDADVHAVNDDAVIQPGAATTSG